MNPSIYAGDIPGLEENPRYRFRVNEAALSDEPCEVFVMGINLCHACGCPRLCCHDLFFCREHHSVLTPNESRWLVLLWTRFLFKEASLEELDVALGIFAALIEARRPSRLATLDSRTSKPTQPDAPKSERTGRGKSC